MAIAQCMAKSHSAYNLPEVYPRNAIRLRWVRRIFSGAAMALFCALSASMCARGQASADGPDGAGGGSRVLLVLPFDNRTGQPSLEWIREAAAEILSTRFASAGFQPTSRADRMYALDHLGLPQGFQPSRASALKLAQTLDADSIVVGSYTTDGSGDCGRGHAGGCAGPAHAAGGERERRDAGHDCRVSASWRGS